MYKKEFDNTEKRFKSYLFWGEEPYYIERYTKNIADSITEVQNRLVQYFDEYNFEQAKNYLSQSSLFGDTNLLIIKHEKALPKKELQSLLEICTKNANSYLIFALQSSDGKKLAPLFSEKNQAVQVRFFKATPIEAKNELIRLANQLQVEIESFALDHLLATLDNNLSYAVQELKKLSLLKEKIGPKEIDTHVYALNPLKLESLYKSIIQKKPIEELFQKIMEEEQNEMKVLLGFENFLQQLFRFYAHIRLFGSSDSKEILGYKLPKQIEQKRVQLAIRIKNYPDIFLLLQECELKLKTKSSIDKEALLFSYLIKVQALF